MIEVQETDILRSIEVQKIIATQLGNAGFVVYDLVRPDADNPLAQAFAAHRQQAEDAILRAADKWLATQYGLRPLVADIDRIRGIDAGGEGE